MTRRSASEPGPAPRSPPSATDEHRAYARRVAGNGFALLAHAVNACDNPATLYRFGHAEREQFLSLCARLYALIETGTIETRDAAMAQDDFEFQRFVNRSLAATAEDPADSA